MSDNKKTKKIEWDLANRESVLAFRKDCHDNMLDARERKEKLNFLFGFTKANKEVSLNIKLAGKALNLYFKVFGCH